MCVPRLGESSRSTCLWVEPRLDKGCLEAQRCCCGLQTEDRWLPTESSQSGCVMACQHQLHYVSLNSGSGFTGRAPASHAAASGPAYVCVCVRAGNHLFSSPLPVKHLTAETSHNCWNKVIADIAIRGVGRAPGSISYRFIWTCPQRKQSCVNSVAEWWRCVSQAHWPSNPLIIELISPQSILHPRRLDLTSY